MGDGGWSRYLASNSFLHEGLYPLGRSDWIAMESECIVSDKYVRVRDKIWTSDCSVSQNWHLVRLTRRTQIVCDIYVQDRIQQAAVSLFPRSRYCACCAAT